MHPCTRDFSGSGSAFGPLVAVVALCALGGCHQSPVPAPGGSTWEPTATDSGGAARLPLATIGGEPVWASDLSPALAEVAGGLVLEELVLDRNLARALASAGITISREETEQERALLIETIAQESGTDGNGAARSLGTIRVQRGLGPARFDALLTRNAGLRALVRREREAAAKGRSGAEAAAEEDAFRTYLEREFGARASARVIVVPTAESARVLRERLMAGAGGDALVAAFAKAAFEESVDARTAARGGLLGPVSPADATLSPAIAGALRTLAPMEVSGVLNLERTFGLVLVESRTEGTAPTREEAASARTRFELRRERDAMDALAQRLVAGPNPTIFDEHLNWSWESRPKR